MTGVKVDPHALVREHQSNLETVNTALEMLMPLTGINNQAYDKIRDAVLTLAKGKYVLDIYIRQQLDYLDRKEEWDHDLAVRGTWEAIKAEFPSLSEDKGLPE